MADVLSEELNGIIIPPQVARAVLRMGRDAFAAALKRDEIPNLKLGKKRVILGAPFRQMVGLEAQGGAAA